MKAYSYTRFSSKPQELGGSLSRQVEGARAYAAEHHLELDDSLRDLGRSAYSGDHRKGALGAFLALIEKGQVEQGSVLIIEAIDRLSREEVLDAMSLMTNILNAGVSVVTLEDRNIYSRQTIRNQSHLMYILVGKMQSAHEYSKRLSTRVTDGRHKGRALALQNGRPVTRMCPGWLKVVTDQSTGEQTYEPIPDRVATVHMIYKMLEDGYGRDRIVAELNKAGRNVFDRAGQGLASDKTGQGWHTSYVVRLVKNAALIGDFVPTMKSVATGKVKKDAGPAVRGVFPQVIDRLTWERFADAKNPRGRKGRTYTNLLTGIVLCHDCGSQMVMKTKGERRPDAKTRRVQTRAQTYLVCGAAFRRMGCKMFKPYPYQQLESRVIDWVSRQSDFHRLPYRNSAAERNATAILELDAAKAAAKDRIRSIVLTLGTNSSPTVGSVIDELEAEIAGLEVKRAELERQGREINASLHVKGALEIVELMDSLKAITVEAERYQVRSRIASIIRRYIDAVWINSVTGAIAIYSYGGDVLTFKRPDKSITVIIQADDQLYLFDSGTGTQTLIPYPEVREWWELMRSLISRPGDLRHAKYRQMVGLKFPIRYENVEAAE